MAFNGGFGRESGPSAPPKSQPVFGQFSSSSPPSLSPLTFGVTPREASQVEILQPEHRPQLLVSRPQQLPQSQISPIPIAAVGGPSVSFPKPAVKKKVFRPTDFPSHLVPSPSVNVANLDNDVSKDQSHAAIKRTRSPPLPASHAFQGKAFSTEGDDERELEAKAKRMARFKAEISAPTENVSSFTAKVDRSKLEKQRVIGDCVEGDDERELEAKAKRLARFKTELSAPTENVSSFTSKVDRPKLEKQRVLGDRMESDENFHGDVDIEGSQTPGVIVGLCPDMCPVSERGERERKGDLDQYERLDGDRNQSSKELAVKKYTRTAEREAGLIRPLPILQKTMDYLLSLLDQPYSDCFLGMYNFLWDRMRAIRMDLRMQHIFNLEAITLLEQMIRLHIIAMHELCEYTKGEGFSEGFDAHLNIEQMNKTSVELFQMYDDYRKKGVCVPTEKEFRGYYALLKLDKHPGYKVEPAELSLDLAKMTPEIRQTHEVLFARDVARSCRTGNFIAFFRLGIKASYVQACLMHAHFSKLRTQALASLHSGLQNTQGLPVAYVAKWLGLENEGVQSLLEYHGFSFKEFGELYMVKDGPFLNIDKDFPTRCSALVHSKKSKHILEDVISRHIVTAIPLQPSMALKPVKINTDKAVAVHSTKRRSADFALEEVIDFIPGPSSKTSMQLQPGLKKARNNSLDNDANSRVLASSPQTRIQVKPVPLVLQTEHNNKADKDQYVGNISQPSDFSAPKTFSKTPQVHFEKMAEITLELPPSLASPKSNVQSNLQQMPLVIKSRNTEQKHSSFSDFVIAKSTEQDTVIDKANSDGFHVAHKLNEEEVSDHCYDEQVADHCYDEEVANAKLKLFLRLWRRRCARKRVIRQQNKLATNAALNSLSVGPPIQRKQDMRNSHERFNIDEMTNNRYKRHDESWSRFSVSDLVAGMLCERNPHSSCVCWKVALCYKTSGIGLTNHTTHSSADQWLHSKLMPSSKDECSDDLIVSSPGIAIWRKWITEQSQSTCCLSVIKSISSSSMSEDVAGANGVVFLISDGIELETQKVQLQNLVAALPYRSCTPLLILSSSRKEEFSDQSSDVVKQLGLHELDKSRISSFLIVHLQESQDMNKLDGYYSDKLLREGLYWLASKSHTQPILRSIKTKELVLSHLNTSLDALDHMGANMVGPNECISAFNEALDKSVEDIVVAANANPMGWPCPELSLLQHDTDEYRASKLLLPTIGWSSTKALDPFLFALRHCKLAVFLDDTSFLSKGSEAGDELEEQRLRLLDCLISYLNQSSQMMNLTMAMKEANIMIQKSSRLQLHNTSYYVVPNWILVFRRVFNWRLNMLSSRSCSTAYILEKDEPLSVTWEKSDTVPVTSQHSYIDQPSLDEMMEVSLTRPTPLSIRPPPEAAVGTGVRSNSSETYEDSPVGKANEHISQIQLVQDYGFPLANTMNYSSSDFVIPSELAREDRLAHLIEQCNKVQNKIAEKLSIYS